MNKEQLKLAFLEYFRKVPVKRYASHYIGKDEDTVRLWEKEDSVFSEQMMKAKAEYLLENMKIVKDKTWLLERLFRDEFALQQKIEHTGEIKHTLTYEDALKLIRGEDVIDADTIPKLTEGDK